MCRRSSVRFPVHPKKSMCCCLTLSRFFSPDLLHSLHNLVAAKELPNKENSSTPILAVQVSYCLQSGTFVFRARSSFLIRCSAKADRARIIEDLVGIASLKVEDAFSFDGDVIATGRGGDGSEGDGKVPYIMVFCVSRASSLFCTAL